MEKIKEKPRVLITVRNHIGCEWVNVRNRDIVAIRIDGLLVINMYNQKHTENPKK